MFYSHYVYLDTALKYVYPKELMPADPSATYLVLERRELLLSIMKLGI